MILSKCTRLMVMGSRGSNVCGGQIILRKTSSSSSHLQGRLTIISSTIRAQSDPTANIRFETGRSISNSDGRYQHQQLQARTFSTNRRRRRRGGGGGGMIASSYNPTERYDESQDNNEPSPSGHHTKVMSSEQFLVLSKSLLDRVESAVTKLKDCNDGLEITRYPPGATSIITGSPGESEGGEDDEEDGSPRYQQQHGGQLSILVESTGDLYWGGGTYWLTILPDNSTSGGGGGVVVLQSPLSGSFTYIFDDSSGEWVGSEDGHSLLGMLTRDWIRQCRGVPDF